MWREEREERKGGKRGRRMDKLWREGGENEVSPSWTLSPLTSSFENRLWVSIFCDRAGVDIPGVGMVLYTFVIPVPSNLMFFCGSVGTR